MKSYIIQKQAISGLWRIMDGRTKALALDSDGKYLDQGGYHQRTMAQKRVGRSGRRGQFVRLNPNTIK